MYSVIIVLVCVFLPYCVLLSGIIMVFKNRDNNTIRGMVIGLVLVGIGGLLLIGVSALFVHELFKYAPYLQDGLPFKLPFI
jgi:hypothetical protein